MFVKILYSIRCVVRILYSIRCVLGRFHSIVELRVRVRKLKVELRVSSKQWF